MTGAADAALRKGWCPGALRPMMARDGLLVRLRITGGIVPPPLARTLAGLARRHGNGLFELSARGNLQMRGVDDAALPALLGSLHDLGLLDEDARGEAIRNVVTSPLAGFGRAPDLRPIARALEARLAAEASRLRLPTKFGFLVDDGVPPTLADVAADVRFDWCDAQGAFTVGLGGTRRDSVFAGWCATDDLVERAFALAVRVTALQDGAETPRRMAALLSDLDPGIAKSLFGLEPTPDAVLVPGRQEIVGFQTFGAVSALGLAVPFGRLDSALLERAASIADDAGCGDLRLTPWRAILVPLARAVDHKRLRRQASGFIVDPDDPRLRVAACVGAAGCARGTTATHDDAAALAAFAPPRTGPGPSLHVSGCRKGCAHPSPAAVTLVGRDGFYDLVRDGRPGDPPSERGLHRGAARAALAASDAA